jgi:hypothetical protein
MAYEARDLFDGIQKGILDLKKQDMDFAHHQYVPKPEYLTTASIAFALNQVGLQHRPDGFNVRCEELTRRVWNGSLFSWLVKRSRAAQGDPQKRYRLRSRQRESGERKGEIDITLLKEDGFAFAIVETKGILRFTQTGELYSGSAGEVEDDLKRNAEYILKTGHRQGVQYSAFTFYAADPASVIEADAAPFRKKMEKHFQDFLTKLNLSPSIKTHVYIGTFDKFLYEDEGAARELTANGAPSQDMDQAWHTVYGIISLYLEGNNIIDTKGLPTTLDEAPLA